MSCARPRRRRDGDLPPDLELQMAQFRARHRRDHLELLPLGYPEDEAELVWTRKGLVHAVVRVRVPGLDDPNLPALVRQLPAAKGYYCGYVHFPRAIMRGEAGRLRGGLAAYAPVHGGITYGERYVDGSVVYGFDCGHAFDELDTQTQTHAWVKRETEKLGECLRIARRLEMRYRRAHTRRGRLDVIREFVHLAARVAGVQTMDENIGAALRLMTGNP